MNILIISKSLPYPTNNGEKIRLYNLIKNLSKAHRIFLITLVESADEKEFVPELKKYCSCVETVYLRKRSKLEHLPGLIHQFLLGRPLSVKFILLKEMREKIKQAATTQHFDIIQIEHSYMAPYFEAIPKGNDSKKVLVFHNIGFMQLRRMFMVESDFYKKVRILFDWIPMIRWEPRYAVNFDKCITTSGVDKDILHSANPKLDISVIPNGVDLDSHKFLPVAHKSRDIIFIGKMDYEANVDAVLYFYEKILPDVRKHVTDCNFFIIGGNNVRKVRQLGKEKGIFVEGQVNDVWPYYEKCALSVVPLRAGGGTRLKILESMALGRPVVSTSLGCEGLEVTHGENILIADKPEDFSRYVAQLLLDVGLRQQISENARKLVESKYGWDKISMDLIRVYEELTADNNRIERK
jgi:sugar transferase (PEP-CTERM/EpsH1 system associated)